MPNLTSKLGLKKPLGNEFVSRAAYNENLDILDTNAAKAEDLIAVGDNIAALAGEGRTTETVKGNMNALAAHLADNVPHIPYATAAGSANAYTVSLDPAPGSYTEGMALAVKINAQNTGAATININGLGAKSIKKPNGNDASAGNLKANSIYTLRYNGANFILQGEGGGGNASVGDVLTGKTFSNEIGEQVGTMPNRGSLILTPSTAQQSIPAGYHNGSGYVKEIKELLYFSPGIYSGLWVQGYATESGWENASFSPQLSVRVHNRQGSSPNYWYPEFAFVTNEPVDLTGISAVRIVWYPATYGTSYLVVSTSKMGNYSIANASISRYDSGYAPNWDYMSVSGLSGSFYIRVHTRGSHPNSSDSPSVYALMLQR